MPLSQLPLSTRVNRWMLWIAAAGVVVLLPIAFVAALQINSQGDVLARVDTAVANQQQTGQSTECAREITSGGEVAQLETLATLQDALLDLITTNDVSPAVEAQVRDLDATLAEAIEGYETINAECPAVTGDTPRLDGNPNSPD